MIYSYYAAVSHKMSFFGQTYSDVLALCCYYFRCETAQLLLVSCPDCPDFNGYVLPHEMSVGKLLPHFINFPHSLCSVSFFFYYYFALPQKQSLFNFSKITRGFSSVWKINSRNMPCFHRGRWKICWMWNRTHRNRLIWGKLISAECKERDDMQQRFLRGVQLGRTWVCFKGLRHFHGQQNKLKC